MKRLASSAIATLAVIAIAHQAHADDTTPAPAGCPASCPEQPTSGPVTTATATPTEAVVTTIAWAEIGDPIGPIWTTTTNRLPEVQ